MTASPIVRTVYIVSDSTGITAETFSHSVLSQFDQVEFKPIRLPFIDTLEKADETAARINRNADETGVPPIVFSTLVNPEILTRVRQANGVFLDLFGTFVSHIEQALGLKSSHSIGRSHMAADSEKYRNRIDAINFSLAHDDGQFVNQLDQADVILVGVSRCGKTPTSLYLAMQYAIKAANFPLTPDDFERNSLPKTIAPYRSKLFGLSIQPDRLAEVRNERRPNSQYATIEQCRYEVAEAERMMRREGISWLSTTTKSIEEIATTVLQEVGLGRY
ncbi:pyruvate, water dikinase regulatory protein [Bordetella pseudohinzii]|uniref:Putative phosphoenolpyruvate synthase regulatory protein n=1 Tax=Bordetella pseudohinzii TaxID=1331258 RepID=A0A0J6C0I8_9BORD|nr:pyruvate, water dikinase regulatory protein [Bordetella pseudohinzii]ANY16044.1 phosphoenolpyruvate synthase regulatory protein [Bordetella pseudohinzii]KMM24563.1 PEP synthetase regulatory protein [Bordetella pseudohinzii]KXA76598.1 phosphoenolpyruvate synthase regulatory protein [Bordetella pseudohinzii]KXA76941.1 phosphoenolpyruvate synthase regulatory protein [Bordetella pseudohinzii]CUJ09558.1 Putative phosphotransferase ydiA [Bordetella pseudohinzii]